MAGKIINMKKIALLIYIALLLILPYAHSREIFVEMGQSIQDAINASMSGDKIVILSGVYKGFSVDKTLYIEGRDTIIEGEIKILANNVSVENLVIKDALYGIEIKSSGNAIRNCSIVNCSNGLHIEGNENEIVGNKIFKNKYYAIWVDYSHNNKIISNQIYANGHGMYAQHATNCYIAQNIIENNEASGIRLQTCANVTVKNNEIRNNGKGIYLCCRSENNLIYQNNFIDNKYNAYCSNVGENKWSYNGKGNYWSDCFGKIYEIGEKNVDECPAKKPWSINICQENKIYITYPVNGSKIKENTVVRGVYEGNETVMYKIDNGSWEKAYGKYIWSFYLNISKLNEGKHTIFVKAGNATDSINIYVEKEREKKSPAFELIFLLLAFLIARKFF